MRGISPAFCKPKHRFCPVFECICTQYSKTISKIVQI